MKCSLCGNADPNTLFDEGDKVYCANCCHRTIKATGKPDIIRCPYCGRKTDGGAVECMWCGNTISHDLPQKYKRDKNYDRLLADFDKSLNETNIRYWLLRD